MRATVRNDHARLTRNRKISVVSSGRDVTIARDVKHAASLSCDSTFSRGQEWMHRETFRLRIVRNFCRNVSVGVGCVDVPASVAAAHMQITHHKEPFNDDYKDR